MKKGKIFFKIRKFLKLMKILIFNRQDRHKNSAEPTHIVPISTTATKKSEEIVAHDEPPPPGEESSLSLSNNEVDTKNAEKQSLPPAENQANVNDGEDEKASSDDTKHAKKSREKKKHKEHKKDKEKDRKKKKRDRKEKKSAQHSPENTPEAESNQNLKAKTSEDGNNHSSTPPPLNETDNEHLSLTENDGELT